ncbi:succinate dehydrogenase cytochrome b subunit [Desulfobacterales bacterium HSG16]|nr:succinate dehydrogenase cytochrome b subunit [Desulfobacterales bacterium HSG16]
MNWFTSSFGSSIGKKLLMALTGLCFVLFLVVHLAGNLTLYGGGDLFNSYAEHLHSLGFLINISEFGLLFFALIHIITGTFLFLENLKARPVRYAVNKTGGGRTIGSFSMPYTGLFMLIFIITHLLNFHFVDKTNTTIYDIVTNAFSNPLYVMFYVASMVVVAIHISHGFWSLFQTIGFEHPKYTPFITGLSTVLSIVFGVGFGFIPIYISFIV